MNAIFSVLSALVCAIFLCVPQAVRAQEFPDRPINLYVGFPAGGGADILARFYTTRLQAILKQQVLIQNRPGANGNIASQAVARSKPDGYSLLFGPSADMAGGRFLYKDRPVDPLTDLTMIAPINELGFTAVVKKDSSVNSIADLVAFLKNKPNANFASSNSMSLASSMLLQHFAQLKMTHVPYKATADAIRDVNGGDIDFMFADGPFAIAQSANGQLKMLGVTTPYRFARAADVPTMIESGYKDFEITGWFMIMAPKGTPANVVKILNEAFNQISRTDDAKEFYAKLGSIPLADTPENGAKKLVEDTERWRFIAKVGNIEPQ